MSGKMMYILTLSVNYYYRLKRFDTQINELTDENSIKANKNVETTNKKTLI